MVFALRLPMFALSGVLLGLCAIGQSDLPRGIAMRGQPVDEPERWSGVWEDVRANGSAVGLIFELTTAIHGAATSLRGVPQYESNLQVSVFERHGPEIALGDANYFSDYAGYFLHWDGKRLRIGLNERADDASTVIVDVRYDGRLQQWTGYMRRKDFAGPVTLRRPHGAAVMRASAMVGTWARAASTGVGCVHVAQRPDRSLTGWADTLQTPGLARYGNGLKPPATSYEHYGQSIKVAQTGNDLFTIEFNPFSAGCCPRTVIAKVHGKTARFLGEGLDRGVEWRKIAGGTCRNETPPPTRPEKPCPQP